MKKQSIIPLPSEKRSEFISAYDYAIKYHIGSKGKKILKIFKELYEKETCYKTTDGKTRPLLQMMKPFPARAALYVENNKEALQAMESVMEAYGIKIEFPLIEYIKVSMKDKEQVLRHCDYLYKHQTKYRDCFGQNRLLLRKDDKSGEYFVDSTSKEAIQKLNDSLWMLETADETGPVCTSVEDFANQLSVPKDIFRRRYPAVTSEFLKKMYLKRICYKDSNGNREPLVNLGWKDGHLRIGVPAKQEVMDAFLYFHSLYTLHWPTLERNDFKKAFITLPSEDIFQDIYDNCEVYTDEKGNDIPVICSRKQNRYAIGSKKSLKALLRECEKRGITIQQGDLKDTVYQYGSELRSTNSLNSKLAKYYKREKMNTKN